MNSLWGIELGILGACLDWEVAWERNVGLLLAVDLGPVYLWIGTGWHDRRLQHSIVLLLEAGPEGGKLSWNDPLGSQGSFVDEILTRILKKLRLGLDKMRTWL